MLRISTVVAKQLVVSIENATLRVRVTLKTPHFKIKLARECNVYGGGGTAVLLPLSLVRGAVIHTHMRGVGGLTWNSRWSAS